MASLAARILGVLDDAQDGLTVEEISGRLGIRKSHIVRILGLLYDMGLVSQTPDYRYQRRRINHSGVVVRRLTDEERARLDAGQPSDGLGPRWREENEPMGRQFEWPPEEILRRMLADGRDIWIGELLGVSSVAVAAKRRELGVFGPGGRAATGERERYKEAWARVLQAWRSGRSVAECLALLEARPGQNAGSTPAGAGEPQAAEHPQAGETIAAADQTEAEEPAAELQLQVLAEDQDNGEADQPADLPLELVDVAATPQHLCARCLKADVCPTPEVLSGYRPEVPALPVRLAGAVDFEVRVEVRSCRYYLPAPDGESAAD
ncbi:MAG: winged helix-turn-helix domain-containing protein [Bacillota bacterium]|nr:MAG: hypothetical protein DIU70_01905 [Bacillota bacterium]